MLFQTLYNSEKFAVFSLKLSNDDFYITHANETAIRMMSLEKNSYKDSLLSNYTRVIDFARMKARMKNCLLGNCHDEIILEFVVDEILTHWQAFIVPVEFQCKNQILIIAVDISLTINKRNKNLKYLQTFFENTPDYFYILDFNKDGEITMEILNDAKAKSMKSTVSELTGKKFIDIYGENSDRFLDEKFRQCLESKETQNKIINSPRLNSYRNITMTPLFFNNETKIAVYSKDMSELIKTQNEKDRALKDLDFLFQTNSCGMCILNVNEDYTFEIIKANTKYYEMLEQSGLPVTRFPCRTDYMKVLETKQPYEGQVEVGNGRMFFNISIVPKIEEDKVVALYLTCVNCTEELKLAKRLSVHITDREEQILSLVAAGNSNKSIAAQLKISEGTVKKTIYRTYQKLDISCRSELIKYYLSDRNLIKY